jgi:hypothetical protein
MKLKIIIRGLLGYVPLVFKMLKRKGTGGTDSAQYCYSVWLRHLVILFDNGMKDHPKTIAEIGPGDSLGIGLNALITGSEKYYAFDIIEHGKIKQNIEIFDELVTMYKSRQNIPHGGIFGKIKPALDKYDFPDYILTEQYMSKMLDDNRINNIRNAIYNGNCREFLIKYEVIGDSNFNASEDCLDLIYSQAVMEHVDNVNFAYNYMHRWLKKGAYLSHEIDYSAHETHNLWYGHWTLPFWIWKIILKGRSYSINRFPNSYHVNTLKKNGFKMIFQKNFKNMRAHGISKSLKNKVKFDLSDLEISSSYIIAQKQ